MTPDELLSELRDIEIVWHQIDNAKVHLDGEAWNFWCNLEIVEKKVNGARIDLRFEDGISYDDVISLRLIVREILKVQPDFKYHFFKEYIFNESFSV